MDGEGWGEWTCLLVEKGKKMRGVGGTTQMRTSKTRFHVLTLENVAGEIKNGTNADMLPECLPLWATTSASPLYASAVPTPVSLPLM